MKRLDASPMTLFVLGLFAALKGVALVVLAEAVATGVVSVIAGTEQWRDAAALAALDLSRAECRAEALRRGWEVSARQFFGNIIEAHGGERLARDAA